MKTIRRLCLFAVIAAYLGGCSSEEAGGDASSRAAAPSGTAASPTGFGSPMVAPSGGAPMAAGMRSGVPGAPPLAPSDGPRPGTPGNQSIQSGTLTAGAWDDNLNFDRYMEQRSELLQRSSAGALPTSDREHVDAHELWSGERAPKAVLDIALVIDTTGSMGDEIRYLQTELVAISQSIQARYPEAEQRWSLIAYRDAGDEYVTRTFPFTEQIEGLRADLNAQSASGGGDMPEAPDAALAAMNELEWRDGDASARLAFWIADAPHHAENAEAMADAIRSASALDVHIYPVASSGIDDFTELTMRSAAQLTGGRYLFLTDDSGVGAAHKEPNLPCYFVTRLDQAMLRMVDIEMTGRYREPDAGQIIRTGGDPSDGACTLESGERVEVF